ncbi:pseudouridylate synthase PUS7L-like [Centroberyx affinis]|uniref:pseudouridylate synthase PUS7L-like n=1 Tax=Centroberyx affinis TaxID=166261 RepID=UPI003A5C62EE
MVMNIRSISEPLRLGRLQGNHFDLVVRDLRPDRASDTHLAGPDTHTHLAALVQQAVENIKARGFVNYYGPQRFGSGQSVQSDQVGLALLKEDMGSAVRLFFTPEEGDDPQSQAKRHFLQTGNTVRYPENAVGTWYQERLARDGLENCCFRVGALKCNLPGCYRPLLAFPRNLKHQLQSSTTACSLSP